jgi:hypothetical protein
MLAASPILQLVAEHIEGCHAFLLLKRLVNQIFWRVHSSRENPPAIDFPRPSQAATDEPDCCAIDVPDKLIDCIGELHSVPRLNLIHRAKDGVLDLGIVDWFTISFLKPITPQNVPTPHDEVAFASTFTPNRGKERKSFTAHVEAPCLVGATIEIDYQGLAAPIRASHHD